MKQSITISDIKKSACGKLNTHLYESATQRESAQLSDKHKKIKKRPSKEVQWMHWQIFAWCKEQNLLFFSELQFHDFRKYRFDFAVTNNEDHKKATFKIGIEYHGLNSKKSGHTTITGFTKDQDKARLAQSEGWKVLAFTVLDYKKIIQELDKFNE